MCDHSDYEDGDSTTGRTRERSTQTNGIETESSMKGEMMIARTTEQENVQTSMKPCDGVEPPKPKCMCCVCEQEHEYLALENVISHFETHQVSVCESPECCSLVVELGLRTYVESALRDLEQEMGQHRGRILQGIGYRDYEKQHSPGAVGQVVDLVRALNEASVHLSRGAGNDIPF
jgi:hypothetical protein